MKRLTCVLAALLLAAPLTAQTVAKRDSAVADSLTRLRPYLNGWRLTSLNNQITTLRGIVVTPPPPPVNQPPVASFTKSCDPTTRVCSVNAAGSTDDVGIVSYAWAWGDGSVPGSGVTATHTYALAGTYTMVLTVRDAPGLQTTMPQSMTFATGNLAPIASFTGPSICTASTVCTYTSTSTDDKAVTGYSWDCNVFPACAPGGASVSVSYPPNDVTPRTVTLKVTDAEGLTSVAMKSVTIKTDTTITPPPPPPPPPDTTPAGTPPTRAELPRSVPAFVVPASVRTVRVTAPMDLQAALNAVQPNDSLVLSGTFTGNFVLPTRACGSWVTVASAGAIPGAGTRVTPATATGFAKIVTPNSGPALKTVNPTCGWHLSGLDISGSLPMTSMQYGLVWLGDGGWVGGGETQTTLAAVPQQILVDHLYIHGSPTLNSMRCLSLNSGATIVRDSYIAECHGAGFDSQALVGWNGPGPYLIENNYLEGSGENLLFGGADPGIVGLSPSDITIRRNYITKPLGWKGVWAIKNLFELKNARRVLFEANVLENTWQAGQSGMAVVIKSSQDSCGTCTWQGTGDLTMRYNRVSNAHIGFNVQGYDDAGQVITNYHTQRVTVEQNLFDGIGTANGIPPQSGWLLFLTHDIADVLITRNTFIGNTPGFGIDVYTAYGAGRARRVAITNNILASQGYYALGSDNGSHSAALTALAGTSWQFTGNAVSQVDQQFWGVSPPGNTYVTTIAQLGLTSTGASTLFPTLGADIAAITTKTAGVVVSVPSALAARRPVRVSAPRFTAADRRRLAHSPQSRRPKAPPKPTKP